MVRLLVVSSIPLIEDDRALGAQIVAQLRGDGFDTTWWTEGRPLEDDDYLTKPFWPRELLLRVRARLRRPLLLQATELSFGSLRLDAGKCLARVGDAPGVALTRVELAILEALVRRYGEPVTREWLVEHALGHNPDASSRALDVHVSNLHRKLGDPRWIETVWGIGYRVASPTRHEPPR